MTANKEGSFTAPPAHAPQEITSPQIPRSSEAEMAARRDAAILRAEERGLPPPPAEEAELSPFAPPKLSREAMRAILGKDPEQVQLGEPAKIPSMADKIKAAASKVAQQTAKAVTSSFKGVDTPIVKPQRAIVITDLPEPGVRVSSVENNVFENNVVELPTHQPPQPHQPAASNTDSPSRGIPTPIADEGKKITGGFGVPGDGADAQYFPLDGTELRGVVLGLMDELARRIEDDLRFSIACTYPRAHVRVVIEVDAYGVEKTMEIPKVAVPHTMTPKEVAKKYADEICFVVISERQEMTESGESVTPPNRMRQEVGLEIPHKHAVDTPTGRQFVDVKS